MLRRMACVAPLLVAATVPGGCGTLSNQNEPGMYFALQGRPPRQPFGGVGVDIDSGWQAAERYMLGVEPGNRPETLGSLATTCAFTAIDLPLSAVADVLMLPFDVAHTLRHQDRDVWAEWEEEMGRRATPTKRPDGMGTPSLPN
jgi:uncharacterized protein YceK